jgi:hypothetical protein
MRPMTEGFRSVEVKSPSARAETAGVLRVFFHIALWSTVVVSIEARGGADPSTAAAAESLPFVARFQDLDTREQRIYRSLGEGIGEAERRRSREGKWPTVEALAADGIPPFAVDPIDQDHYTWKLYQKAGLANYVGTPSAPDRPTYVAILAEPEPGVPNDPSLPTDEVHQRLSNGMLLHVGVFLGNGFKTDRAPVPSVPFDEGWKQILIGPVSVLGR